MPGLSSGAALQGLGLPDSATIMPVVGLVNSNRAWLDENAPQVETVAAVLPADADEDADWAEIFDAGDEAVQLSLPDEPEQDEGEAPRTIVLDESDFS